MEELRETLKTSKEVIDLIGKDTVFEFQHSIDNTIEFKSVIPFQYKGIDDRYNGDYMYYTVDLFINKSQPFFKHDTFENFLSEHKIFELSLHSLSHNDSVVLFHQKYNENK